MKTRIEKIRELVLGVLLVVSFSFSLQSSSYAEDIILDGDRAINWLQEKGYVNKDLVPQHNFHVFRSLMTSGGSGPHGLRAIIAGGWKLTGPLDTPLLKPIVIIVDDASLNRMTLIGKNVTPQCHEVSFSSSCTATVFDIGSTFVCAWDRNGCTDSVFTIMNIVGNKVEMYRADQRCPASPGLTATYGGVMKGKRLEGQRRIVSPGTGYLRPGAGDVSTFSCDF